MDNLLEDVIIEKLWSTPERNMLYSEQGEIYVQVRNISRKSVEIERITCIFECESDLGEYAVVLTPSRVLEPGHLSSPPFRIPFKADISLKGPTNSYKIGIEYRGPIPKSLEKHTGKSILLLPLAPAEKYFFISHKDPKDSKASK